MPNAQQRPTPMSWRRSLCSCSLLSSAWFLTMRRWAMGERPASVIKKGSRKLTHTISIAVFSISNYAIHTMYGMYTYIPGILYIYISVYPLWVKYFRQSFFSSCNQIMSLPWEVRDFVLQETELAPCIMRFEARRPASVFQLVMPSGPSAIVGISSKNTGWIDFFLHENSQVLWTKLEEFSLRLRGPALHDLLHSTNWGRS